MDKFIKIILLFIVIIFLIFPSSNARAQFTNDEDIIKFIKAAFQVQVSLSEMDRSMLEINELLSPYFTESAKEKFMNENLVEENERYFTLGTDFPLYYIPFFNYDDKTEIIWGNKQIYVVEYFPRNVEGPVHYDAHYEGVLLEEEEGLWKVADFLYNLSPMMIGEEQQVEKMNPTVIQNEEEKILNEIYIISPFRLGLFLHPIADFYRSGYSICNSFFNLSKLNPVMTVSPMTIVGVEYDWYF